MAYNTLSGTVTAPDRFVPRYKFGPYPIISGNLSTSDASQVINIPRVTNATNNSIITNVGGDANTLTCESNLLFDGTTLSVTGDISASVGISASVFIGDGSRLTGVTSSGGSDSLAVNGIGNTNGTLQKGFNYGTATFNATRTWTTPASPSAGDVIRVKAPDGVSSTNALVVDGYANHTIDGQSQISIESPYGAVALCYVSSGSYRIF
jgi:hypothetical protein